MRGFTSEARPPQRPQPSRNNGASVRYGNEASAVPIFEIKHHITSGMPPQQLVDSKF